LWGSKQKLVFCPESTAIIGIYLKYRFQTLLDTTHTATIPSVERWRFFKKPQ